MLDQIDNETLDTIFNILIEGLNKPEVKQNLAREFKLDILAAANVTATELSENVIQITVMFMNFIVDASDLDSPKISISMDMKALERYTNNE